MTLTSQQRQTTQRVDLGGDALEAIQALRPTVAPRTTVVTVTAAGLTFDQLIAAARSGEPADQKKVLATTRRVTLENHGNTITRTTGGAAPGASSTPIPTPGIGFDGTASSLAGMRFYGANVAMSITEEG
jgi:hypothetical protein